MTGESLPRKLAAILYADVAGYSRLTGADEEGTHRILSRFLDLASGLIGTHNGAVIHYAGDAILADFPTVTDALRCAVAIQTTLGGRDDALAGGQKVQFRIGVNLGEVIVDRDDIYGDGVNVAARLESLSEPGGICISGACYDAIGTKLPLTYEFAGEQQVKNIERPVRTYRVVLDGSAPRPDRGAALRTAHEQPAVAVLPFINLGGDPEQEYFADGLTEDLISALSSWRAFPVIARNSMFTYKGRAAHVQDVADELGARYVLEGSVRSAGGRIRVAVKLIDGNSGHPTWAAKYDRPMTDVFDIQDEITEKIAAAVQPELLQVELQKSVAKRPENLTAWDYFLRGMSELHKRSRESSAYARDLFQQAIDLEPEYGEAWAGISWSYSYDIYLREANDHRDEVIRRAVESGKRAVELDDGSAIAHYALGMAYVWNDQLSPAVSEGRRALQLNPFFAQAQGGLGNRLDLIGETREGIEQMLRSIELNPRDPTRTVFMVCLARAHSSVGEHRDALEWIEEAVALKPDEADFRYRQAICLANLDRSEEAQAALAECERLRPGWLNHRAAWQPYADAARNDAFFAGFRKYGLP